MTARILVLTGFGLNCDYETAHAFEIAGGIVQKGHINALIQGVIRLVDYNILVFGGGFSWGDDHGAGVIQAVRFKTRLYDVLMEFIFKGNLIIGICNGFQTLVNLGLLPGFTPPQPDQPPQRTLALIDNDCGNFRDDWVFLKINPLSPCVFTRGLNCITLPIRHGEGKLFASPEVIQKLSDTQQIVLRYAAPDGLPAKQVYPHNPNGSLDDIAGICDAEGRIFGLMPHPEAFNHFSNHPRWTYFKEKNKRLNPEFDFKAKTEGIQIFQNAVTFFK